MAVLLSISGMALIVLALVDLFVTVLTTRGGGPISSRLGAASWSMLLRMHRSQDSRWALAYAGPLIAILTVMSWILMFWTGWLLIFSSEAGAVVRASTGEPADLWARLYFSGYTLFTLGLGDYRPDGALWQVLTALAVGNGFLVISLSASYLIPLVSAATSKRSVALHINSLGGSPSEILITSWDGRSFSSLGQQLTSLTPLILQAGQQHLAYPVLHYYQSTDLRTALPVQIAKLGEALDILEHGIEPQASLPQGITAPAREATRAFARVQEPGHLLIAEDVPPPPDLEPLRRAGVPVVNYESYRDGLAQRREERRRRLAVVQYSGWSWDDGTGHREETA